MAYKLNDFNPTPKYFTSCICGFESKLGSYQEATNQIPESCLDNPECNVSVIPVLEARIN